MAGLRPAITSEGTGRDGKGGCALPNDPYYQHAKHKRWRALVLRRDKYLCRECARYGKRTEATHAHHIRSRKEWPELAYDVSNGVALCNMCHARIEMKIRELPKGSPRPFEK